MTTSLSAVVLGYLALVALISMSAAAGVPLASAARTGAVVAELLLIAHAAVDLAAALRKAPTDPAVHFGYVMISVALLPLLRTPSPCRRRGRSPSGQARCPRPGLRTGGGRRDPAAEYGMTAPAVARTGTGGQLLVAAYTVLAVATGSRAAVQLATRFSDAPVAYLLSAAAAAVYLVAALALRSDGRNAAPVAAIALRVELVGVLAVGTLSLRLPEAFPDETVWSVYGLGYGLAPLVLPVLGLRWLRRIRGVAPC